MKRVEVSYKPPKIVNVVGMEVLSEEAKHIITDYTSPVKPGQMVPVMLIQRNVYIYPPSSPMGEPLSFTVFADELGFFDLSEGDQLGILEPLGNGFPLEEFHDKEIFFFCDVYGYAALRSLLFTILKNVETYYPKSITIFCEAFNTKDFIFKEELSQLATRENVELHLIAKVEKEGWKGEVGTVVSSIKTSKPKGVGSVAALSFRDKEKVWEVLNAMAGYGFRDSKSFVFLGRKIRLCKEVKGRDYFATFRFYSDGPVFDAFTLRKNPREYP
jgi:NAD(P)H-flavin reductase